MDRLKGGPLDMNLFNLSSLSLIDIFLYILSGGIYFVVLRSIFTMIISIQKGRIEKYEIRLLNYQLEIIENNIKKLEK